MRVPAGMAWLANRPQPSIVDWREWTTLMLRRRGLLLLQLQLLFLDVQESL